LPRFTYSKDMMGRKT